MRTGDVVHTVANPLAKGIDAVLGTKVAGCAGCKKMRENLNQGMSVADAIYERWFKAKQQGEKMKYQMTIVIEADTFTKASEKAESIGEVISAQVKPAPPVPQSRPVPMPIRP